MKLGLLMPLKPVERYLQYLNRLGEPPGFEPRYVQKYDFGPE
jgi:hypothetical protein